MSKIRTNYIENLTGTVTASIGELGDVISKVIDKVTITPASDADVTLSATQNKADVRIIDTGSWTASHSIICDDEDRQFVIINNSGFVTTITTSGTTPTTYDIPSDGLAYTVQSRAGTGIELSGNFGLYYTRNETITPGSDADVTLTAAQNASNVRVLATGSWLSGHSLICDDADREFTLINNSGYTATVTTSGTTPTTVDVPHNESMTIRTRAGVGAEIAESCDPFSSQFLHIQDQKPSGTNGGTSTAGYNTRDLNTVLTNEIAGASLASNLVTLPAGIYYIEASAPAYRSNQHQLRVYNNTTAAYILSGTSETLDAASIGQTRSFVYGRVSIASESVIKLRHAIRTGLTDSGLGVDSSLAGTIDHNTYTDMKIWRIG